MHFLFTIYRKLVYILTSLLLWLLYDNDTQSPDVMRQTLDMRVALQATYSAGDTE